MRSGKIGGVKVGRPAAATRWLEVLKTEALRPPRSLRVRTRPPQVLLHLAGISGECRFSSMLVRGGGISYMAEREKRKAVQVWERGGRLCLNTARPSKGICHIIVKEKRSSKYRPASKLFTPSSLWDSSSSQHGCLPSKIPATLYRHHHPQPAPQSPSSSSPCHRLSPGWYRSPYPPAPLHPPAPPLLPRPPSSTPDSSSTRPGPSRLGSRGGRWPRTLRPSQAGRRDGLV